MADVTLKLSDRQIPFIKLILRSKDVGDGWRIVNGPLLKIVAETVAEQPELYETKEAGAGMMIRVSADGAVLARYL